MAGQNTDDRLKQCLAHAARDFPDAVHTIFAGDLSDDGARAGYIFLRDALADWASPVTFLMGNEDDQAVFAEVFPYVSRQPDGRYYTALRVRTDDIFCLDSLDPQAKPRHSGVLGNAQMEWLAAELEASTARRKIVVLHHPPAQLGLPFFDAIGLRDGAALCDLMARADVTLCLAGHVHRAVETRVEGVAVKTLESTGFGLRLGDTETDVAPDPDHIPHYAVLRLDKPRITLEQVLVAG